MKKPRPANKVGRKRRAAGWTLLTLGVIVAGVWVASGWWAIRLTTEHRTFVLGGGELFYEQKKAKNPTLSCGWQTFPVLEVESIMDRWKNWWAGPVGPSASTPDGIIDYSFGPATYHAVQIGPWQFFAFRVFFWPLPILLVIPAALVLRSGILARRRAVTNACPKCGYSLAGLGAGALCPECGKGAANS